MPTHHEGAMDQACTLSWAVLSRQMCWISFRTFSLSYTLLEPDQTLTLLQLGLLWSAIGIGKHMLTSCWKVWVSRSFRKNLLSQPLKVYERLQVSACNCLRALPRRAMLCKTGCATGIPTDQVASSLWPQAASKQSIKSCSMK